MNHPSQKHPTSTSKVKVLFIALALVVAALIGFAAGDAATAETSEAAYSWASSYSYGWSWR